MRIEDYEDLNELDQIEALWIEGVLIGYKIEENHKIELYKLHNFFVELIYHLEYKVQGLKILSEDEILEGYIKSFKQN